MGNGLRERLQATERELGGLVAAVRRLIDATVVSEAPGPVLEQATAAVEHAIALLASHRPAGRPPRFPDAGPFRGVGDLMPFDPVMGPMSPLAPPLAFRWEQPRAVAEVRFGTPYEGPPGCVHGGIIAAAFDQVFNIANVMSGAAGPTAKLSLRYRRPTPLGADLRFEGWQERVEGRRIYTAGRLLAGDRVTVEAHGLFVLVPVERIMRMLDPGS